MSFLDQSLAFLRWKKLIILLTLAAAVASVVISLILPKWYLSTASIFPPEEETFSLGAISSLISAATMGSSTRASLPIWATPSDVYAAVLRSRTVREEVVRRNDLLRVYHAPDMDRALRALDRNVKIKVGGEGVVQIKVMDRDPKRAAAIANDLVALLDQVNRSKRNTSAHQARVFLEGRLDENRRDMARAEQTLRAIQESTGVLIPEDQFRAIIEASTEMQVQLMMKEVDLKVLSAQVGAEHPDREALERQVNMLKRRMDELEGNPFSADPQLKSAVPELPPSSLDLPLRRYPAVQLAYLRALREVTVQEAIYEFLNQEYERYRIQESRDTPTVQVLDAAVPATYKARPIRSLICAGGTLLGFLAALLLASFFESLRRMRAEAPDRFERVRRLAGELRLGGAVERL